MSQNLSLTDKVAVVTGGGRGIGRAAAVQLAQAGAAVVVTARTAGEVEQTVAHIEQDGGRALAFPADVTDWEAMTRLAEATRAEFGPADILVANAGILGPIGDSWTLDPAAWAKNVTVNVSGTFNTIRAFLPEMVSRKQGVLIFVSSGAANRPVPGWNAYCASKAGVEHFARTLTAELEQKKSDVRVYTFYPGVVSTAMQEEIRSTSAEEFAAVDNFRAYHQQGVLRPPEEPGTVIRWLATPAAADLHGQAASIDDNAIRERVAADLEIPPFKGRER